MARHHLPLSTSHLYRLAFALLLVLSAAVYLRHFNFFQVGMGWDDAQYVQLAQSIAQRRDYVVDLGIGEVYPTRYPFGFPLVLSPIYLLTDGNLQALKLVSLIATLLSTSAIFVGWRYLGFPSRSLGFAVAALYAFSPSATAMSGMVMSEPTFLVFALLSLILTVRSPASLFANVAQSIGLAIVLVFASHARTIGISVVIASVLYLLWRKKWLKLCLVSCGFIFFLMLIFSITSLNWRDAFNIRWYLNEFSNAGEWKHTAAATSLVPRAQQAVSSYLQAYLLDTLAPPVGAPSVCAWLASHNIGFLLWVVSGILSALIMIGYIKNVRDRHLLPAHGYVVFYGLVTILWPFRDSRFLYGILPFLFAYLLIGVSRSWRAVARHSSLGTSGYVGLFTVGVFGLFLCMHLTASLRLSNWVNHTRDLEIGTTWIRQNTPEDAIVVAEHNEIVYPYVKRATAWLPDDLRPLDALVARHRAVYLLVAPELLWSETGELRYSAKTERYLQALKTGHLRGELTYENVRAMTAVYLLEK